MTRRLYAGIGQVMYNRLLILGRGSTSNNFHQLASDDGLTGSVVDDLELADHVSGVLGGVLHMTDQYQFSPGCSGAFYLRPWRCGGLIARTRDLRQAPEFLVSTEVCEEYDKRLGLPSRASWQEHIPACWLELRRRFRKQRSLLLSSQRLVLDDQLYARSYERLQWLLPRRLQWV